MQLKIKLNKRMEILILRNFRSMRQQSQMAATNDVQDCCWSLDGLTSVLPINGETQLIRDFVGIVTVRGKCGDFNILPFSNLLIAVNATEADSPDFVRLFVICLDGGKFVSIS